MCVAPLRTWVLSSSRGPALRLPRLASAADVPALAQLYAHTARTLGGWCYGPQQVQAWAAFGADTPAFSAYVLDAQTWVFESDCGELLGFCGVAASGEVHSLYVHASHTRQGLGSAMLAHALAQAGEQGVLDFAAWVTPFSKPVFERAGFRLTRTLTEDFNGAQFERYRVECP